MKRLGGSLECIYRHREPVDALICGISARRPPALYFIAKIICGSCGAEEVDGNTVYLRMRIDEFLEIQEVLSPVVVRVRNVPVSAGCSAGELIEVGKKVGERERCFK